MITRQAPVTLELRNTPGKNTNQGWYTHISQLTQFMPSPATCESEIGSQPTLCQVHTGAYFSLLAPRRTDSTACHPRKTTTYIYCTKYLSLHMRTTDASQSEKKKQRKEEKVKGRKDKKAEKEEGKERKEKTRSARKDKTRRGSKERKRQNMSY